MGKNITIQKILRILLHRLPLIILSGALMAVIFFLYTSFFATSEEGTPISEIKQDPEMVGLFAENLVDYISLYLGSNLSEGSWCMATTPRRRHAAGFHFSTEVCRTAAERLGIPFREDIVTAKNRTRVNAVFKLEKDPGEHNVILYDDILTTGTTLKETRRLLLEKRHTVLPIVAIRNQ